LFFRWDGLHGVLSEKQSFSTLPRDFHGVSTAAEIRVSPDGHYLYSSNRGHDSTTVFSINPKNGQLTTIQNVPSGGENAAKFDFDPTWHWLLVTNQDSSNAQIFRVDPATGRLTPQEPPVAVPSTFSPRFLVSH
jgi:6-phosphogluconolactonase